jgi:hypothetical protein
MLEKDSRINHAARNTKKDIGNLMLPVKRTLGPVFVNSIIIAALITAQAILGLVHRDLTYPTNELILAFVPNDVVNLLIGLPILIISMWLTFRGKLLGLLFWPGALFYVLYNYLVYIFAMPLNVAFLINLILVTLSAYALADLVARIDGAAVRQRLSGAVPERLAGAVLIGLGLLFLLRVVGIFMGAIFNQTSIPETELALNISDFLISPAPIIGGVLLWRRKAFGYVTGLGLLFQQSMLFIGLIAVLVLQPFMIDIPFASVDVIVVAVMGLVCFVPFVLFARGVLVKDNS